MNKIKGTFTALITPFEKGRIDYQSLEKLIQQQLENKINGFVVNGTTAESPTLDARERSEIFSFIRERVPKSFPLIMGTGSNSTAKTIEDSQEAEKLGADALLVVVPYYNKPPQRGLLQHFQKVAASVKSPILLYNVPSRTITSLELDTILALSAHPNIVGIKEASGNMELARQIRKQCGPSFSLLSGDDGTYDTFIEAGGDGVISVASHILPSAMLSGAVGPVKDLIEMLFVEANPIPLKMALKLMGLIKSAECRLPLVELAPDKIEPMRILLKKHGLI